jgi:large repetitive protein
MTRIGLMGHSRGGDAVSSFVEYDHTRPVRPKETTIKVTLVKK